MRLVKRLVTFLGVVALLVTGCVLFLSNSDPVVIDLVWLQIPRTSLAVVLSATFFIGVATGAVFVLVALMMPTKRKSLDG
jgi:hypothetical protein